jgi:ceramide glucosyltransferase
MWVYYVFAALLLWQSLLSLLGGVRYLAYFRREMAKSKGHFHPFASVIVPCRGLDQGLEANIEALFDQGYPAYELLFVTDAEDDPALKVIERVRKRLDRKTALRSRFIIAGNAESAGQKVHNLLSAVSEIDPTAQVLIFADTDARPRPDWLASLVAPLSDERIGATTGYRWFIPVKGGVASYLRSVWNASIASALGARGDRNFCWGGSTAVLRFTLERLNVTEHWRGALSDDFSLMRVLRGAGLQVYFVPACLNPSFEDCGFHELLEFTTRQMKITRVYARNLWIAAFAGSLLFATVFFGGIAMVAVRAALGLSFATPALLLVAIFALGTTKAYLRFRAVGLSLALYRAELRRGLLPHLLLWPLASALYLYNAVAAWASRRIEWRGITYELKSPSETVIIQTGSK